MFFRLAVFLCVLGFLGGCANVTISPVSKDDDGKGVRYWEPWPYLLVSQKIAKDGSALGEAKDIQIIYLPNMCKQRKIEMSAGFGSAEMEPQLTEGWMLTGLGAKADSKVSDTIGAIASLIPAVFLTGGGLEPGIYPLVFNDKGALVGFGEKITIKGDASKTPKMGGC